VAQKIQVLLIDDLDGTEAEGTVRFAVDGTEYEIDLNAGHAWALREALALYQCRPADRGRCPEADPWRTQGRRGAGWTPQRSASGPRRRAST
jgi:Lsr2